MSFVGNLAGHDGEAFETGAVSLNALLYSNDIHSIVMMTIVFLLYMLYRLDPYHGSENLTLTLAILYWKGLSSDNILNSLLQRKILHLIISD